MSSVVGRVLGMLDGVERAQFARFTYRAKGTGELAKHTLILGASTENVYKKDIETLEALLPGFKEQGDIYFLAANEILASLKESLEKGIGNNSANTNKDTFVTIPGLPNVKVHKETGDVYVDGLSHDKVVLEAGEYKEVKSSPKTIAKNSIRRELRSGKYRRFIIGNLTGAAIAGDTVEFTGDVRPTF